MTARCPTCDREGCNKTAAYAAYQGSTTGCDALRLAVALIEAERACQEASAEAARTRRAQDVAERKRAFDEMRSAAAKWAAVVPLIERLRKATKVARHDYATDDDATIDPRVTGHEMIDAVANLLAANEATP